MPVYSTAGQHFSWAALQLCGTTAGQHNSWAALERGGSTRGTHLAVQLELEQRELARELERVQRERVPAVALGLGQVAARRGRQLVEHVRHAARLTLRAHAALTNETHIQDSF